MVRHKQQVYDWFNTSDSATRVDFVCSLLELYCSPWEWRIFATSLEHLVRNDYEHIKEFEMKANDYKELQQMTKLDFLHGEHHIRGRLVVWMCLLRSRPPNARCSQIFYDILMEMDRHMRASAGSLLWLRDDENFVEDIRLLLTIAIHHPAFTFSQHQDFQQLLVLFDEMFGRLACDPKTADAQCQTDFAKVII